MFIYFSFHLLLFVQGILIRLKICIGFLSVFYIWIFAVTNVTFEGHDICLYVIQIDNTSLKFIHSQSLDFYD